jgi:hypothetical protein
MAGLRLLRLTGTAQAQGPKAKEALNAKGLLKL